MFPYTFSPYHSPSYGSPTYSYSPPDSQYFRALAEEQAARQAYADALRAQEDARARAARARRSRHAYERPHSSYLSDEDEDELPSGFGYTPAPRASSGYGFFPEHAMLEEQRRREIEQQRRELEQQRRREALELERAHERERIRLLEEEQKRRMLQDERRKRMQLEEELRRQQEAEEEERRQADMRRRLQNEYLRRQSLSPLEELLGLRPSRSMQHEVRCAL